MLTKEQIKNLKPGDPIVIDGTVNKINEDGHILATCGGSAVWIDNPYYVSFASEHGTSVPTPKYDPTRLFKEGDWVRIVKHQGRKFNAAPPAFQLGKTYRVSEDENTEHCYVMLQSCDLHYAHPVAFLELVTPVEELEPYFIYESKEEESFDIMKRVGKLYLTRNCIYYKSDNNDHAELTREEAKAAAEAECKRLNEEYRK